MDKLFGHLIRNHDFFKKIIEWKIEGRRKGRPRLEFEEEINEKIKESRYGEVKESIDREEWRRLNQQRATLVNKKKKLSYYGYRFLHLYWKRHAREIEHHIPSPPPDILLRLSLLPWSKDKF